MYTNEEQQELIKIIQLIRSPQIGDITFHNLLRQYGSIDNVLEIIPYLTKKYSNNYKVYSKSKAKKELEEALSQNINIISYKNPLYPPLLKQAEDHPPILFVKGNENLLKKSALAIIGSRNASTLGKKLAYDFSNFLGKSKFAIVSGMAKGIDAAAHQGAINTGTVAFLGGGVNNIYPKENTALYHEIAENGALVSEFQLDSVPQSYNFPKRNRLIAGMCRGVLVVEANLSSGSIITANIAADLGREVFAIPNNPSDPRSTGTNQLIKNGAVLTENPIDIINNIKPLSLKEDDFVADFNNASFSPIDKSFVKKHIEIIETSNNLTEEIYNLLSFTEISIDAIVRDLNLPYNNIQTAILELELSGKAERLANNKIVKLQ